MTDSKRLSPPSSRYRLRRLDGRTREAKFLRRMEAALITHMGGAERVSVAQRILVERVAADLLRLELLDEKASTGTMTEHDGRVAHALRNSVRLALKDIGLKAAPAPQRSLGAILADERRERGAAE